MLQDLLRAEIDELLGAWIGSLSPTPTHGFAVGAVLPFQPSFELFPGVAASSGTLLIEEGQTDASGTETLAFLRTEQTFLLSVQPPPELPLEPVSISMAYLVADTSITVVLPAVDPELVTLSGVLRDRDGTPIPNQSMGMGGSSTTTAEDGSFSLSGRPGPQTLSISSGGDPWPVSLPNQFFLDSSSFDLEADLEQDVTLQNVLLHVVVQDSSGTPIPDVALSTTIFPFQPSFDLFPGVAASSAPFPLLTESGRTNPSGMATLAFLRTQEEIGLSVQPPTDTGYAAVAVSGIDVSMDGHLAIVLVTRLPVPLAITSFRGQSTPHGVELEWEVFSDEEVRGFQILRSSGKTDDVPIGNGLLVPRARSFRDAEAAPGMSYTYTLQVVMSDGIVVSSSPVVVQTASLETFLSGRVPNPFRPNMSMSFSLARDANVRIGVYDMRGRRVVRLLDHLSSRGVHKVMWDGLDDVGRPVASGTYFVRFEALGTSEIRKIALLR